MDGKVADVTMSSGNSIREGQGGAEEIKVTVVWSGSSFIFKELSGLDQVVDSTISCWPSVFDRCCFFGRLVGQLTRHSRDLWYGWMF